jgi:mono/diheme cytochrome c family protein
VLPIGLIVSTLPPAQEVPPDGRTIYTTRCMACHQANGKGIPGTFPPLDGTEWVRAEKGRLVRIVLHGMMGPATVQGVRYNGAMPPWGAFLNDEEAAAVLTYVRTAWSNRADVVTPQEVAAVRAATKDRKNPWTHAELSRPENAVIPTR